MFSLVLFCSASHLLASILVTTFGAIGDGINDDTSAIQQAIDAAAGIGQGNNARLSREVIFPTGTYRITQPIQLDHRHINISIRGNGYWCISGTGDIGVNNLSVRTIIFYDGNDNEPVINCFNTTGPKISNMVIDGNNKASDIIRINCQQYGSTHFYFERLWLKNGQKGISLGEQYNLNCADMTFTDLVITNMGSYGFYAKNYQQVNYVFIRPLFGSMPVGCYFGGGSTAQFILPCFHKVDDFFVVKHGGVTTGTIGVDGLWFEQEAYSPNKRPRFAVLEGRCIMTMKSFSTTGHLLTDQTTPLFRLSSGAQLTIIGSTITGVKIADMTGGLSYVVPSFLQFINCRFSNGADPRSGIDTDQYSGYILKNCNIARDTCKPGEIRDFHLPEYSKYPIAKTVTQAQFDAYQ